MKKVLMPLLTLLFLPSCVATMETEEFQNHRAARYSENVKMLAPMYAAKPNMDAPRLAFLCTAYAELKDFNKLFSCVERLKMNMDISGRELYWAPEKPMSHILLAKAHIELRDFGAAENELSAIFEMLKSGAYNAQYRAQALTLRGVTAANQGNYSAAANDYNQLTTMKCDFSGGWLCEDDRLLGKVAISVATREFKRARDLLSSGSASDGIRALAFGVTGYGGDTWLFKELPQEFLKAKLDYILGDLDKSAKRYKAILEKKQTPANATIYWNALADLGRIDSVQGRKAEAIKKLSNAITIIETQRSSIDTEAARIGFVGDKQTVYLDLVNVLVAANRVTEAFDYVERAKARALVDMLSQRKNFASVEQNPAVIKALLGELDQLEQQSLVQTAALSPVQTRGAVNATRNKLTASAPELASLVTVSTLSSSDVQARIGDDEVLVEYTYHSGGNLYAFVVTKGDIKAVKLNGAGLDDAVNTFRRALHQYEKDDWKAPAMALYQRLIAPLSAHLNKPNLLIVPHGALHYLPFNALYDGSLFMIDRFGMRTLPSASVLRFLERKSSASEGLLILGNPDLGDPKWDLPGADAEARSIAKVHGGARVVLRKQATETIMKKAAGQFKYLHLASHGQFNAGDAMGSRMMLAPDNDNDGNLTVNELYDLRLNADLVVLSACETGLGKVSTGDDVVGLSRGFLYAGARSIVSSLWQVSDDATKLLMTAFYKNLNRDGKRSALKKAQLATRKKYPHPLFWSAFQMTGAVD
jgi:CHAT domain-containing protein